MSWEWTAGVGITFGGVKDKDKDGIIDADDQCRDEPEDIDNFEDEDGCPDTDNDGDGILDSDDACADEAEDDDDFEDSDGCPDPDNDKDEILDGDDECPNVAGMASAKGCPDADEDTVVDEKDECPEEAGEVSAFGCPDDDSDRVPNYRDECPDEPIANRADPLRSNGCPSKVFVAADAIQITEKIFFDTGKATIKKESFDLLGQIAATLKRFPGIKKVSIEGHTDNVGDADFNKTLSEQRAASVRTYLIETGEIDEGRLEAKGFGKDKPIATGEEADTDEGRAKNRRVEFKILEQEMPKNVLKRPKVTLGKAADDKIDIKGLVVKNVTVPEKGFVTQDVTCNAKVVISAEGKVTKAAISECVSIARLAATKSVLSWEFEPYEVDGTATRVSTEFEIKFEGGEATVKHLAKNLKPLE
jgi:outer membrane protein OmpA-like peptidoglycan-associated protein